MSEAWAELVWLRHQGYVDFLPELGMIAANRRDDDEAGSATIWVRVRITSLEFAPKDVETAALRQKGNHKRRAARHRQCCLPRELIDTAVAR